MAEHEPGSAEAAVRRYLQYLEDPSSLRDEAAAAAAEEAVRRATDPIEKLRALSELERVSQVDPTHVTTAFLVHAKAWAEANGITVGAFRAMGVPEDVLAGAGLLGAGRGRRAAAERRATPARRTAPPAAEGGRAPRTSRAAIEAHVLSRVGPFTIADVMRDVGGTPMTVTKVLHDLMTAGTVRRLDPDPDHQGRGRAPFRYERV